ncbi:nitrous oxide reductase accessory protein NosL [Sedimenticola thiotaurini]|uniref:nitrous oxide reductase accessory protein NosL n=1 Tax=Sedimenticola thiotaurini TaxID=1543721 RepID=UPI001F3B804F|nr:nitrous oxide reductase accessory protein NosL [Sedimenticola thiotaurini]
MTLIRKYAVALCLSFGLVAGAVSEPVDLPAPKDDDTCPVCGMFVAKYPAWVATVRYKDGHLHHFDGAKDLFKYLLDLPRWAPGHQRENIQTIGVTEYYTLTRIDAQQAWYVIGSDVLGPMGHELIPLETPEDAEEFMQDHQGVRILRADEVSLDLLEKLDRGEFE